MSKALAIVGGGPKAAALVARAAILRDLGIKTVPTLYVFEKKAVGSAWSGDGGFSSGHLTLCSPAEKDVGFPYAERELPDNGPLLGRVSRPVGPALYARFSWSAYLVATGGFAEWVDRGRGHPNHARWASYLEWVFKQAGQAFTKAEVLNVTPQPSGGWHITYRDKEGVDTTYADGVVLTGTGKPKPIAGLAAGIPEGKIFDAESFWAARNEVRAMEKIAVTGSGGAAGAIIAWLSEAVAERKDAAIQSISSLGTLFPRGDGYAERRWFSDPDAWRELSFGDRRKILARTEVGVISDRNKSIIDSARNVVYARGRASAVAWDAGEVRIDLGYHDNTHTTVRADCMISAIGFDPWRLLDVVDATNGIPIPLAWGEAMKKSLEEEMQKDLSFPPRAGLGAGLHVPALAALAQGPGMATLGSLGLLASAILDCYL